MAESERATALFTNTLYDRLKFLALIVLPALATFVLTVGHLWDWASTDKLVGTITALDIFLGVVLQISTKRYYGSERNFDGEVHVYPEDGGNRVKMEFNGPPEDMVNDKGRKTMEFKVSKHRAPE